VAWAGCAKASVLGGVPKALCDAARTASGATFVHEPQKPSDPSCLFSPLCFNKLYKGGKTYFKYE